MLSYCDEYISNNINNHLSYIRKGILLIDCSFNPPITQ